MRMSPLDVRKQEFRRVLRGFDTDEVHAFLETVADELESVLSDNQQLSEQVGDLDEKVTEYRNLERSLRDTLLTAERVMTEARQNARKEAELILREAVSQAQSQAGEFSSKVENLKVELRELRANRDEFLERLHSLARAEMQRVETYRKESREENAESHAAPTATPVGQEAAQKHGTSARELWRDYSLSQVAQSEPSQPVDTGVEVLDAAIQVPTGGESERGSGSDGHSPLEVDRIAAAMVDMSRERSSTAKEAPQQTPEQSAQNQSGPAVTSGGHGGHDPETVATYPRSDTEDDAPHGDRSHETGDDPAEPEEVLGNRSKELPERVTDSSPSRWSLSRFTRALSNF